MLFAFIAVLVFTLSSRKVLFINRKENKPLKDFLRELQISRLNYGKVINRWNGKFSEYF